MNADQVAERGRILDGLVTFVTRSFMVEASELDLDKSLIDQGLSIRSGSSKSPLTSTMPSEPKSRNGT